MSDFLRRLIGAVLLIATMGFSSCMALLEVGLPPVEQAVERSMGR